MTDNSLPKPVLPRDQSSDGDDNLKMPSSAMVKKPAASISVPPAPSTTPPTTPPTAPPTAPQTPPTVSPAVSPAAPSSPPGGMVPPAMGRPPSFPGMPPKPGLSPSASIPTPSSTATPAPSLLKPAVEKNNSSDKNKIKSQFANVKQSPFKYLPFIVGGLVLISIVWFVISSLGGGKTKTVTPDTTNKATNEQTASARKTVPSEQISLIYWGLWEPDNTIRSILDEFEAANPGVKVSYVKQSHKDYRERLQTAIASGNGPDLFRYHAGWTPMLVEELAPMPQSIMSAVEYSQTFYPAAAKMLNINDQIVGIPLMYDSLGLYFNKDMIEAADATPPSTWAEVKTLANKLAIRDGDNLKRGGIAVGNASNVEHYADILGLLMLQNGADPTDPSSKEAQDALSFYTNFVKQDEVWDDKLPSSTVAFARGDVAMMLAPSWRIHEVETINPELNFGIAPVPRLGSDSLTWATFWAEGVNNKSANKDKAWALLKFLSSKEVEQKLYSSQSQIRSFGEIYSRVDLADELANNEKVSPFLLNASVGTGWYLNSYTHDNGLNDLLIKYYEDAINAVLGGESVEDSLITVTQGTNQILRQYGVK